MLVAITVDDFVRSSPGDNSPSPNLKRFGLFSEAQGVRDWVI
jgi:hypothetical protein